MAQVTEVIDRPVDMVVRVPTCKTTGRWSVYANISKGPHQSCRPTHGREGKCLCSRQSGKLERAS